MIFDKAEKHIAELSSDLFKLQLVIDRLIEWSMKADDRLDELERVAPQKQSKAANIYKPIAAKCLAISSEEDERI